MRITFRTLLLCYSFILINASSLTQLLTKYEYVVEFYIPTLGSDNAKCKHDSLLLLENLKQLKVWAADMFDSSSKFTSGLLSGSSYDIGNFDQCIKTHLPESYGFSGQHCMAKFTIAPPKGVVLSDNGEANLFNKTVWERISIFQRLREKRSRTGQYLSFCIPSSCSYADLENGLESNLGKIREFIDFDVDVSVNERNCQTDGPLNFSVADILFMFVVGIFFFMAITASLYHLGTKLEGLEKFKLSGRKHEILRSFSVAHNLYKLSIDSDEGNGLTCLHGLKVWSMFLIIMGHRIMFMIGSPLNNAPFVENIYKRPEAAVLLNGPIIVDTFFTISGFLSSYLLILEWKKRSGKLNPLVLYLHRLIRLTPAYLIILAFYCTIFVKLGSGAFWSERIGVEQERCLNSWWTNLLYINNYVHLDNICMFQSWYLACDTHLFLLAPLLSFLFWKRPKFGVLLTLVLTGLSLLVVFVTIYLFKEEPILLLYMGFLRDPVINSTFKYIYMPSHMRATPYLVGILTGYVKYKMRSAGYKMPKMLRYLGWILCILIMEATVYSAFLFYQPETYIDGTFSALYGAMHRFSWSVSICWFIIAVSEGYGNWISPYLNWKPLVVLSRLTYASFLCHGAIQLYSSASAREVSHAGIFELIFYTAGDITLSYVAGLILSVIFEAPVIGIEKILLQRDSRKKSQFPSRMVPTDISVPQTHLISRY